MLSYNSKLILNASAQILESYLHYLKNKLIDDNNTIIFELNNLSSCILSSNDFEYIQTIYFKMLQDNTKYIEFLISFQENYNNFLDANEHNITTFSRSTIECEKKLHITDLCCCDLLCK